MLDEQYERLTDKQKVTYWEDMSSFYKRQGKNYKRLQQKYKNLTNENQRLERKAKRFENLLLESQDHVNRLIQASMKGQK